MTLMSAIVFALISYFGWGIGDIFGAITTRKIGAYSTLFWTDVVGFFILSFLVPFQIHQLAKLTPALLLFILAIGAIGFISSLVFNTALQISNPSVVGTIASSFSAVAVVLSVIFFKESITIAQLVPIVIIFCGVLITSLTFSEKKTKIDIKDRGIKLAILVSLLWGIFFAFIKIAVDKIGWFWPNYIMLTLLPIVFIYIYET